MKTLKYLFIAALAAFTFNACEDVPAPYTIPTLNSSEEDGSSENIVFEQSFTSTLGSFTQTCSNPDVQWGIEYSSACITGHEKVNGVSTYKATESYLVSPAIDLTGKAAAHIALNYVICYANDATTLKDCHQLLICDNFTGDATKANWTVLDYGAVNSSSFTFGNATVNIPEQYLNKSNIYIALKYKSTESKASTWEVKSIAVKDGDAPEAGKEEEATGDVMTVAQALAAYTGTAKSAVVKGYIVGYIPDKSIDEAVFASSATSQTNIIIADSPNETDINKCLPIQLPAGEIRNKVNLQSNPGNYKKAVTLTGSLEKYFGVAGLKTVTKALFEGEEDNDKEEPTGKVYINETFANDLGSFTAAQMVNEYAWKHEVYNNKGYAKVSGFADNASQDAESWLISPAIDFSNETAATISFEYVINKGDAGLAAVNHKLMITSSYSGDFYQTNWEEIPFGATNDGTWTFRKSGDIAIPEEFMGKEAVVIAFKYTSTTSASSTWEVMNVVVTGGEGSGDNNGGEGEEGGNASDSLDGLTVAQALAAYTGTATPATVKGYIVGYIPDKYISEAVFAGAATSQTNIIIADNPNETDINKCLPIQLPAGEIRNKVNLQSNPDNFQKFVTLTGSLEKYFGVAGLKTVTKALFEGEEDNTGGDNGENDNPTAEPGTIAAAIAAGPGNASVSGTIVATYERGFLVSDNTGSILVYLGEDKGYAKGDVVTVSGATTTYAGLLQFGNTATVEVTGTTSVPAVTAKSMSASDLTAYLSNPSIQYVTYKGTLEISGYYYNIIIDGTTAVQGSLSYPKSGIVDESLNGKEVIVTGYTIGVSKSMYVNTMATSVVAAEGGSTTTPDDDIVEDDKDEEEDKDEEVIVPAGSISVAQAIAAYVSGQKIEKTVTGYIIGYAQTGNGSFVGVFEADGKVASNIIIADTPNETDSSKCLPVALPSNSDIRKALNLIDNPGNLGKRVTITGSLEKYFSAPGLKTPTAYSF